MISNTLFEAIYLLVLGWKNQNCYLEVFYKVILINLIKLLDKVKKFKIFNIFGR